MEVSSQFHIPTPLAKRDPLLPNEQEAPSVPKLA